MMPATFHHGVGGGGEEFPVGRAWCSNRKPHSRPGLPPPGDPSSPASRAPPARELAPELTASGPRSQVPGRSASSSKRLRRTPDKHECGGRGTQGTVKLLAGRRAAVCDHAVRSPFPWRRARSCPRHGLWRPACWRRPDPLTPAAPVLTPPPGTALSASRGARFCTPALSGPLGPRLQNRVALTRPRLRFSARSRWAPPTPRPAPGLSSALNQLRLLPLFTESIGHF